MMNNYDDLSPGIIRSGLKGVKSDSKYHIIFVDEHCEAFASYTFFSSRTDVEAQWCSQGDLLAVAGMERHGVSSESACASIMRNALVKFYNVQGEHIYTLETPAQVSALLAVPVLDYLM